MKKVLLCSTLFLLLMTGMAHATLTTIGTATYNGQDYNLIFEGELGSEGLVWLDYTNDKTDWASQVEWAKGLSFSEGDITIFSAYTTSIDWTTGWRLPTTSGTQYGYDQTSEMGHLFYESLGLEGYNVSGQLTTAAELNATNFENLIALWYWSGTEYAGLTSFAWLFRMDQGAQDFFNEVNNLYGLAVCSGQVTVSSTPIPGAILLLGSGLLGMAAAGRKKGKRRLVI